VDAVLLDGGLGLNRKKAYLPLRVALSGASSHRRWTHDRPARARARAAPAAALRQRGGGR
jgi:hypothetical protein